MDKPPLTVLLLDDDPSVLRAVARLLRSAGLSVAPFADPIEFLQHAASQQSPVAVIDVSMPVMDGLEVQTHLRKSSPSTEVIFLTSRDEPATRKTALDAGAAAFLIKPADGGELLSVIKHAADRNRNRCGAHYANHPGEIPTELN